MTEYMKLARLKTTDCKIKLQLTETTCRTTKIYRKEIADKKAYEKIPINDELTTALCES